MSDDPVLSAIRGALLDEREIEFSVLVGSRASGKVHPESDWDIAIQWHPGLDWLTLLGKTETVRRAIAHTLGTLPEKIDLIDLRRANLAMRANVAEQGLPLTGEDSLTWTRFLTRTWRELEDFYWEQSHAA
ncbi:MAG: nucleotidyltransferase domain-containing protein [Gallionella sp.]